jgi:hypothetical protein
MSRPIRLALLTLLALSVAACGESSSLREAQTAFSDAATADNAARLAAFSTPAAEGKGTGTATVSASAGYARAIALVQKLDRKKLAADKELGVAQSILATAQWKLKDWDNAAVSAQTLSGMDATQVFPRDRALANAMPALIRIDQAHDAIFDPRAQALPADRLVPYRADQIAQLDAAVVLLDGVIASATEGDPITLYLLQAELAALRNKQDALLRLRAGGDLPANATLAGPDENRSQCRIAQLVAAVKHNGNDADSQAAATLWQGILGVKNPNLAACRSL